MEFTSKTNRPFSLSTISTPAISVFVILTFLVALKPNQPLPFHWLVLLILAILLVIFSAGIWACVLVLIAGIIGLIEDL